jgi:3-phenylpropionate/cinnamic acid dioxygenase small subunit
MTIHISDEYQILKLLYLYAERVDQGDKEGVAALFDHADVKWGAQAEVTHGAAPVADLYERVIKLHADGTPRTHHLITNAIIDMDIEKGAARSHSYYTVIQQTDEVPLQVIAGGRYHDSFARVDGAWRFSSREYFMDFRGNNRDHVKV